MSATTYSFASTARISKDEIVHRLENINISSVGFIGLGHMGIPMALNLRLCLPRRVTLYVYDVNNDAIDAFLSRVREFCGIGNGEDVDQWVVKCISSSEIGAKSDVVFTIVPEGSHVRAVYLDPTDGLLASFTGTSSVPEQVSTHKTFVDCSTIDTATSLQVNASVTALSTQQTTFHFYDAPVSGGTHGALAATLTFMVGAARPSPSDPTSPSADTHFTTILYPLLLSMSSSPNSIIPLGGPSLGLVAKLANNYLGGLITIATSEAMNFGMRAGVDAKVLRDVFRVSSGGSWVNETINPVPGLCPSSAPSRGYTNGFKSALMLKDSKLALEAAKSVGARPILGEKAKEIWESVCEAEGGKWSELDARVVYRWLGGKE